MEELDRRGLFLVEILVRPVNRIVIYLDSMQGVTLEECTAVSRFLENRLRAGSEDFELEVSSPGLGNPLKLPVQYLKNVGRILDVVQYNGIKISGKLLGLEEGRVQLETEERVKDAQTGKKKTFRQQAVIKLEDIKTAKVNISLKSKESYGKP